MKIRCSFHPFLVLCLLLLMNPHSFAATHTVSGGVGLQAAIDSASDGDVIEIADSLVYHGDFLIPFSKSNLTVRAASGETPELAAKNEPPGRGLMGALLPAMGIANSPDGAGFIIEGPGTTLDGLILSNGASRVNEMRWSQTCLIAADNVTLRNCLLTGPGVTADDDTAVMVLTGRWDLLGAAFNSAELAAYGEIRSDNLKVEDVVIADCNIGVMVADVAVLLRYLVDDIFQPSAFQGSSTWNRVEIRNCRDFALAVSSENAVWNDCVFTGTRDAFRIRGGKWTFHRCEWSDLRADEEFIEISADFGFGGGLSVVEIHESILCGGFPGGSDALIEIENAQVLVSNTILSVTQSSMSAIHFEPEEAGFYSQFDRPIDFDRTLTLLNSDIHNPGGRGVRGDAQPWRPEIVNPAHLSVIDSIITANIGIEAPSTGAIPGSSVNVSFSNVFAGTPFGTIASGWEQNFSDNLNLSPGYLNPGGCDSGDYQFTNPELLHASSVGGSIGSQSIAPDTPTPTPTPTPTAPPPPTPIVSIEPEDPDTLADLIGSATGGVDSETSELTYQFSWLLNGVPQPWVVGEIFPSTATRRDDLVELLVYATNGAATSESGRAEVVIRNTPPTPPLVEILPEVPTPDDGLAAQILVPSSDVDGDEVRYLYEWFDSFDGLNWRRRPELSGGLNPYSQGVPEISNLYTQGSVYWKVEVTPLEADSLKSRGSSLIAKQAVAGGKGIAVAFVIPDYNGDFRVDALDILKILEFWNKSASEVPLLDRHLFFDPSGPVERTIGRSELLNIALRSWGFEAE